MVNHEYHNTYSFLIHRNITEEPTTDGALRTEGIVELFLAFNEMLSSFLMFN